MGDQAGSVNELHASNIVALCLLSDNLLAFPLGLRLADVHAQCLFHSATSDT